jgi:hypothetical protein
MTLLRTPFPLGRHVNHDPRSLNFPAATAAVVKSVLHTHKGPVLDQGQVGSCTGNATVDALMTLPLWVKGRALTETDALRIYSEATKLDNAPGWYNLATKKVDTGSDGLSAMKAAKNEGLISGYTHAFGFDHAVAALQLTPVICGINWYEGMFTPDSKGFVSISGKIAGGHEICLLGVNLAGQYLTFLNSWGSGWGLKGKFKMTFATFTQLLAEQGDCTVPIR